MELKIFSLLLLIVKILSDDICTENDLKKLFFPCKEGKRDGKIINI